ncbi:hypothetical protein T4E_1886 [Trichinella pseudospiralis]|uniref:Uncharacterized protein n=1 Tax=Trichinella pseudospiralis TaxID=6337 RepID=A0A0V0YDY7_TRIPS|nr:hypothetical protein T4E_1886 [Trichinella pseudospiralis]
MVYITRDGEIRQSKGLIPWFRDSIRAIFMAIYFFYPFSRTLAETEKHRQEIVILDGTASLTDLVDHLGVASVVYNVMMLQLALPLAEVPEVNGCRNIGCFEPKIPTMLI